MERFPIYAVEFKTESHSCCSTLEEGSVHHSWAAWQLDMLRPFN